MLTETHIKVRLDPDILGLSIEEREAIFEKAVQTTGEQLKVKVKPHRAQRIEKPHQTKPVHDLEKLYYGVFDFDKGWKAVCDYLGITAIHKSLKEELRNFVPGIGGVFSKDSDSYDDLQKTIGGESWKFGDKPLTEKDLQRLDDYIIKIFAVEKGSAEMLALRALLTGKLIAALEAKGEKALEVSVVTLPERLTRNVISKYSLTPTQIRTIEYAKMYAAERMTSLQDQTRHIVKELIIQAHRDRMHPRKLAQELFGKIADTEAGVARDWERVAISEMNYLSNVAYISGQPVGSYVIGWSYETACDWCRENIHNKVLKVIEGPPADYSNLDPKSKRYNEIATIWETCIWAGKSNFGRSAALRKRTPEGLVEREHHELAMPGCLCHPSGRCRWFPFSPSKQFVDKKDEVQFRTTDKEEDYQKWLKENPHAKPGEE